MKAAALSSTPVLKADDAALLKGADPKHTVVAFDLMEGGASVARHLLYFGAAKDIALPAKPELSTSVRETADGLVITVTAKRLARAVWVDTGDLDVRLADNAFDLLPGESRDIAVKGKVDVASLRHALTVMSLVDALKETHP